eukprot:3293986-Rhodomonas_salina.3
MRPWEPCGGRNRPPSADLTSLYGECGGACIGAVTKKPPVFLCEVCRVLGCSVPPEVYAATDAQYCRGRMLLRMLSTDEGVCCYRCSATSTAVCRRSAPLPPDARATACPVSPMRVLRHVQYCLCDAISGTA